MVHRRLFWPLAGLTLIGGVLRMARLSAPALRGDEAFAYFFAVQPLAEMFALMGQTEPNPPLYWLALRTVAYLAGNSEPALRSLSVWAGVVVVPLAGQILSRLTAGWSDRLSARRLVLAGALLVAVNPTLVWDSQDARTYALTTAVCLAALWATLLAVGRGGRAWPAAALLWLLGLFSHYFALLAFASVAVWAALTPGARGRRRAALGWGGAVVAAYAPWAVYVAPLLIGHRKGWIGPVAPLAAAWRVVAAVGTLWTAPDAPERLAFGLGASVALAIGIAALARRPSAAGLAVLLYAWLTPASLALITAWRPVFYERYFAHSLPALVMVMGVGAGYLAVSARWRYPGRALVILLLASAAVYLRRYYFDADFAKSTDWRAIAAYLAEHATTDDVVIQNLPDPATKYYYRGPAAFVISPPEGLPADPASAQLAAAQAQIDSLSQAYAHVWFLPMPGPAWDTPGYAGRLLRECCLLLEERFVARNHLQVYETPRASLAAMQAFEVEYADGVRLAGYRLLDSDAGLRPGERLRLILYWRTETGVGRDYTVFTHLVAEDGYQAAGWDNPPVGGRRPTSSWQPGETVIDPYSIPVPEGLASGNYSLQVGLYDPVTLARLPVVDSAGRAGGDFVTLPIALTTR